MRKIISFYVTFLAICIISLARAQPAPKSSHDLISSLLENSLKPAVSHPVLNGFSYWYGTPSSGEVIYLGNSDQKISFETELHLRYADKRLTSVLLILGPSGLSEDTCIQKYRNITRLINQKYGDYKFRKIIKDPIVEDLIYSQPCTPVRLNMYSITTLWKSDKIKIISKLLGDHEGFYIEIEYDINQKDISKNILKLL
jgi:hypothetical protein